MLDSPVRTGAVLRSDRTPAQEVDQAAGYRQLLVLLALLALLALGFDEARRGSDPCRPHFSPANVDNVLKWGMDCPDAGSTGASIGGDATHVVQGRRNAARYLGFPVMGGMENTGKVVADDLAMDSDGRFELCLSATEQLGDWLPLDAEGS